MYIVDIRDNENSPFVKISRKTATFYIKDKNILEQNSNEEQIPDFKKFIDDIMEDVKIQKVKSNYDKVFSDNESASEYAVNKNTI